MRLLLWGFQPSRVRSSDLASALMVLASKGTLGLPKHLGPHTYTRSLAYLARNSLIFCHCIFSYN